jgi:hypothetical protein
MPPLDPGRGSQEDAPHEQTQLWMLGFHVNNAVAAQGKVNQLKSSRFPIQQTSQVLLRFGDRRFAGLNKADERRPPLIVDVCMANGQKPRCQMPEWF